MSFLTIIIPLQQKSTIIITLFAIWLLHKKLRSMADYMMDLPAKCNDFNRLDSKIDTGSSSSWLLLKSSMKSSVLVHNNIFGFRLL